MELYSGGVIRSSHNEDAQKSGVWKTVVRGPAPVPYVGVAVLGSYDVSASVGVGMGVILNPQMRAPSVPFRRRAGGRVDPETVTRVVVWY